MKAATSPEQRVRRDEHKTKKRKRWRNDKEEYDTLLRYQREKEREILSEALSSPLT